MVLPWAAASHHTIWISDLGRRAVAERYAMADESFYCVGDNGLRGVPDGHLASASIHEIAGGPPIAELFATVRSDLPDEVPRAALFELLEHVALGHSLPETERNLETHRQRQMVRLTP